MKSFNSSSSAATDKLPASSSVGYKLTSLRSPSLDLQNSKSSSVPVKCYSLTELLTATGNFASSRLLGEGSIGRVYKAKYADGRVCTSPLVLIPVPLIFAHICTINNLFILDLSLWVYINCHAIFIPDILILLIWSIN